MKSFDCVGIRINYPHWYAKFNRWWYAPWKGPDLERNHSLFYKPVEEDIIGVILCKYSGSMRSIVEWKPSLHIIVEAKHGEFMHINDIYGFPVELPVNWHPDESYDKAFAIWQDACKAVKKGSIKSNPVTANIVDYMQLGKLGKDGNR